MANFRVNVDATELVAGLHELQVDQLPFAMAATLTATAKDAQLEVQRALPGKFTLRNKFTEQGIRIKPAEKKAWPIEADVHTDTTNRKTGAPDYLGLQEEGGEKVPVNGHAHLAVPTRYLRQMAPGVIPAELRPRNLLAAAAQGGRFVTRTRKGQLALRDSKIVRGFEFFIATLKSGRLAIMGRPIANREAYPFYLLIPEAHVRRRLSMEQTVQKVAVERFPRQWEITWSRINARGLTFRS